MIGPIDHWFPFSILKAVYPGFFSLLIILKVVCLCFFLLIDYFEDSILMVFLLIDYFHPFRRLEVS